MEVQNKSSAYQYTNTALRLDGTHDRLFGLTNCKSQGNKYPVCENLSTGILLCLRIKTN